MSDAPDDAPDDAQDCGGGPGLLVSPFFYAGAIVSLMCWAAWIALVKELTE